MSAFRFEEATAFGPAITALDEERLALAAALPPAEAPAPVVPVLQRRARGPRRR